MTAICAGPLFNRSVLLFDFDGTLIDASEAICASFNAALAGRGLAPVDAATIRAMIGRPLWQMFASVVPAANDAGLEALVALYRTEFFPRSAELSRLLPTVADTIPALAERYRLGIVTNRMADGAWHLLDAFGLRSYFRVVVGSDCGLPGKPNPNTILAALAELDEHPQRALMVGDTIDDIEAGRCAGTATAAVTTGYQSRAKLLEARPDWVLDNLRELLDGDPVWASAVATAES